MRWYEVIFETIEKEPITRTVRVKSTDSVHASILVYQQFGRKKIKVKSAKKARERHEVQEETNRGRCCSVDRR